MRPRSRARLPEEQASSPPATGIPAEKTEEPNLNRKGEFRSIPGGIRSRFKSLRKGEAPMNPAVYQMKLELLEMRERGLLWILQWEESTALKKATTRELAQVREALKVLKG